MVLFLPDQNPQLIIDSIEKEKGQTIFAGTQIVNGKCTARVTATGMKTELGNIAALIQEKEEPTPLQMRMGQLGKFLAIVALGVSVVILGIGVFRGASLLEMLIVALALAVAAVPEGLPLTMTIAWPGLCFWISLRPCWCISFTNCRCLPYACRRAYLVDFKDTFSLEPICRCNSTAKVSGSFLRCTTGLKIDSRLMSRAMRTM